MSETAPQQEILLVPHPGGALRLELFVDAERMAVGLVGDGALAALAQLGRDRATVESELRHLLHLALAEPLGGVAVSEPVEDARTKARLVSHYSYREANVFSTGVVWYDRDASTFGPEDTPLVIRERMRSKVRLAFPEAIAESDEPPPSEEEADGAGPEAAASVAGGAADSGKRAFEQRMDVATVRAERAILRHVLYSTGTCLVPVPLVDLAIVCAVQVNMLGHLCEYFDVPFDDKRGAVIVSSLVSSTGAVILAPALAGSLFKFIPGLGSGAGAVSMGALAGASTYALGRVFLPHLQQGGGLLDFEPEAAKQRYRQEFEHGQDVVAKERAQEQE